MTSEDLEAISEAPQLNLGSIISARSFGSEESFLEEDSEEGRPFKVNPDLIATGRTCIIGSSGSGKSYAVGVICEELCKNRVPFVIIDVEGEYSGLKEKYEAIWVGDDEKSDLKWSGNKVDLRLLARYAPDCPPLIFDISEAEKPREKVGVFLLGIYREISKRRTPYLVILEEADRFAPQVGDRLPIFDEIARRGRKRGLGLMLCTQRPSLVDKNILSQCSNQMIGKLVIRNDLNSVAQFFSGPRAPKELTTLSSGEFYALGGISASGQICVKIRARETRHGGMTPKLNPTAVRPSVQNVLSALESESPLPRFLKIDPPTKPVLLASPLESNAESTTSSEVIPKSKEEREKSQGPRILGFLPLIERNDVPRIVRAEKKHKFFGQKETTVTVDLKFHPLVEVGVRRRTGLIKKKFESLYFFLDGLSGRLCEFGDNLSFRYGLEHLLGLEEGHILVLRNLPADHDQSMIEIASATKTPEDLVRKYVKSLEDQRLIRSSKISRTKVYRRMVDLPRIDLAKQSSLELIDLAKDEEGIAFELQEANIEEPEVREIVKGMWEDTDVESFRVFYYPVYVAELVLNSRSRRVLIDGRTGLELG